MAGNKRNLEFSILSDTSKFDAAEPAGDLERLADTADDAGASLEDLERARERLDLDTLGRDADDAARKVDSAFDRIARASRTAERKIDGDSDRMRESLDGVGDEATDTAREMGASFSGAGDDIVDGFQELAANALADLGPVGAAAGAAAALGIGLIRAEQEKLKTMTTDLVQAMIEAGGDLGEAGIQTRVETMISEDPQKFVKQKELLDDLGVSWRDYFRALAGDPEAADRALQQIADASSAITDAAGAAGSASGEMYANQTALNGLAKELGITSEAYGIAKEAMDTITDASSKSTESSRDQKDAFDDLRASLGKPIKARIVAEAPSRSEILAVVGQIRRRIGTIVVPLKPGQSRYANTADNSRYRE